MSLELFWAFLIAAGATLVHIGWSLWADRT